MMLFKNRRHAGRLLARKLSLFKKKHPFILGIPRGAVPMAKVIADVLGGDLDVVLVHKLSHSQERELAIGAIDDSGNAILTDCAAQADPEYLESGKQLQLEALRQRRAQYTPLRPRIDPQGGIVVLVDDGLATGSTMFAALRAVRAQIPTSSSGRWQWLRPKPLVRSPANARCVLSKSVKKISRSETFFAGFAQVEDEEVISALQYSQTPPRSAAD